VLVFHDLTQLKRLESVRADFVANVSHELRTPLTAIKGYAETLLNGALKDPDTAVRFLTIIDRHSERLSRLIDDLLILSNLELGAVELRHDEVALAELTSEVFEVVKDKAERGGVILVQEFPSDLPMLHGDSDRLQQVLLNLIDNAIKYTPVGGKVTVTAKTVRSPKSEVRSLRSGGLGRTDN
jgi:two-component system phosphate regulon sensor histidine kinase PhoR